MVEGGGKGGKRRWSENYFMVDEDGGMMVE